MSVLRNKENSFKLKSRNLKTNGSLEKQIRRSAVVSMLWSPLPLSVTLLCGHSRTWFGYACRMQRAGKKALRPMNVMVRHAWSHTRTIFHHGCCIITHDKNEDVRKRNMDRFDQCFYGYFFLLNVYLHAMHEREEESWIIVHGCMGDKSHLMCSYFWGHREFGFSFHKNKAIKIC